MPGADFPVDIPPSLTSSHSSGCSSDSSLLKSSEKGVSYGAIQTSQTSSTLREHDDLLPLPVLQVRNPYAALPAKEVLLFQYDPFWRRLRTGMLAFFWLFLLALIVAAELGPNNTRPAVQAKFRQTPWLRAAWHYKDQAKNSSQEYQL